MTPAGASTGTSMNLAASCATATDKNNIDMAMPSSKAPKFVLVIVFGYCNRLSPHRTLAALS